MADAFIGEVRMMTFSFVPRGWYSCTGALVSVGQNPTLFSLLGCTYGGDCRVSFGLPNLNGRAPMGTGTGPGLFPRFFGQFGGTSAHVLQPNELPKHKHTTEVAVGTGNTDTPTSDHYIAADKDANTKHYVTDPANSGTLSYSAFGALASAGSGQPHENRQPYNTVRFCINWDGTYPPRS